MAKKNDDTKINYRLSLRFEGMEIFKARGDIMRMEKAGEIFLETIRELPATIAERRPSGGYIEVLQLEIQID